MKLRYFLLPVLLLCNISSSYATSYFRNFVVGNFYFGADSCGTRINCAITVENNKIVFAGHSNCNNQGNIPAAATQQKGSNIIVGKLDNQYNIIWMKVFGGDDSLTEQAKAICATKDGGYAIVSTTSSTNGSITSYFGADDIWLIKLDSGGNKIFQRNIGSTGDDRAISITETATGDLLILGASNGSDGDISSHYGGTNTNDWILIKADSAGVLKWVKTIGGTGDEGTEGSVLAADTNYYIISGSNSTDYDCNDTSWFDTAQTGYNYHLLKLDSAGAVTWDRSYGGSDTDKAVAAIFTKSGNIMITGYTKSVDSMIHDNKYAFKTGWLVHVKPNGDTIYTRSTNQFQNNSYGTGSALCNENTNTHITGPPDVAILCEGGNRTTAQNINISYIDGWWYDHSYTAKETGTKNEDWAGAIVSVGDRMYAIAGSSIKTDTSSMADSRLLNTGDTGVIYIINYGWYGAVQDINNNKTELTAYPNPADDMVYIQLPANAPEGAMMVVNSMGQEIYKSKTLRNSTEQKIDVSSWAAGWYYVLFSASDGQQAISRFVVQ
ncbi:MAG: T9SS type A sorting domain-containing protein [Chitinophagaceae bacterium]|nr:T9SS type A sorting domain-containing protein [Chitinophagaceae bacterium]MCB9047560.1 T9SS type A sorting domain-containing protein [Chitinophagales bacterium]